jgi:polysaccharide biosynthesis transport protein
MKIIDFIRLIRKHIVLLLITPLITAGLVIHLTRNPVFRYASETILYTGIATGSSIDVDKSFSYFANNAAFDNLINVIRARSTHQDVAVRLLSIHLLLDKADPKFISGNSLADLRRITPPHVDRLIVKDNTSAIPEDSGTLPDEEPQAGQAEDAPEIEFSFNDPGRESLSSILPASINENDYEQTVKNLTEYMLDSDTNFVYRLLNFDHPFYSIKAISSAVVQRMSNSDLIRIKYESLDPGICRHTLALLSDVFIKNHKNIKENRTDAVVKYFEFQLNQASAKLQRAEDKLLEFNKANNIINYYEQSKAIAIVKEELDVEYNNTRIKLAGIQAAITNLEEKLGTRELIQLKSADIVSKRDNLSKLNSRILAAEMLGNQAGIDTVDLPGLKVQVEKLKEEIKISVSELYSYNNSVDGIPMNTILNEWINNVIEGENLKAGNQVLAERIREFQKQYEIYAPAGANIKRIEREISISEQEFLEILYGLNLAKLKQQDNELSSNIKPVDPPFFPISPIPTKRKMVILIGGLVGFMLIFSVIFILEYFDNTLKMPSRAERTLKLPNLGVFPKILQSAQNVNLPFVNNRLVEIAVQNAELSLKNTAENNPPHTLLFFSTLSKEGKSVAITNMAAKFKAQGKKDSHSEFYRRLPP